jgi:hypothetical protein
VLPLSDNETWITSFSDWPATFTGFMLAKIGCVAADEKRHG